MDGGLVRFLSFGHGGLNKKKFKIIYQLNEKMKMKRPAPQNDITGIILANQWDEDGNVIGVSVYTDLEEIYIVAQTKQIKE
jgi:hypothetical protein